MGPTQLLSSYNTSAKWYSSGNSFSQNSIANENFTRTGIISCVPALILRRREQEEIILG